MKIRSFDLAQARGVADEVINGALDRGVIMPALGLQEPFVTKQSISVHACRWALNSP
jgi:hypothetical protein